jgi:hypothetical protein
MAGNERKAQVQQVWRYVDEGIYHTSGGKRGGKTTKKLHKHVDSEVVERKKKCSSTEAGAKNALEVSITVVTVPSVANPVTVTAH